MTGPVPDPESGTLDTGEVQEQMAALAVYLKANKVEFTLQYVPQTQYWSGLLINYEVGESSNHIGRYPTEVIYKLLRDAT